MFRILDTVTEQIAVAAAGRPPEWGGALLGVPTRQLITEFMFDADADVSGATYLPSADLAAAVRARELGCDVLAYQGILHRHPDWLDRPSGGDERSLGLALDENPHLAVHLAPIVTSRMPSDRLAAHELPVGRDFKVSFFGARRGRHGSVEVTPVPVVEVPLARDLRAVARSLGFESDGRVVVTDVDGAPCLCGTLGLPSGAQLIVLATADYPFAGPTILQVLDGRTEQLQIAWRLEVPDETRLAKALEAEFGQYLPAVDDAGAAVASAIEATLEAEAALVTEAGPAPDFGSSDATLPAVADGVDEPELELAATSISTPADSEAAAGPAVPTRLSRWAGQGRQAAIVVASIVVAAPRSASRGVAAVARWLLHGFIRAARLVGQTVVWFIRSAGRTLAAIGHVLRAMPRIAFRLGRRVVIILLQARGQASYGPTKTMALTRDPARARMAGWGRATGDPASGARILREELSARSKGLLESLSDRAVIVAGLGSVGSYIAEILARSGVGRIVLVDPEAVEAANLSRTMYELADIGQPKALALSRRLINVSPLVQVDRREVSVEALPSDALAVLVAGADLVVAATDSLPAQRLLNHFAYAAGVPAIFVGLYRGAKGGETIISVPGRTPCYLCATSHRHRHSDPSISAETDYGSSRLVGEVALGADIQHLTSAAAKIALALLVRDRSVGLAGFLDPLLDAGTTYLTQSMTPDYWFYPDVFGDVPGQFAWQSVWLTPTRRADCAVCGEESLRQPPGGVVHLATDDIRRAIDAA